MYRKLILITLFPLAVLFIGISLHFESAKPVAAKNINGTYLNLQTHLLFQTADACMSCHNNLITPSGEDVSIGIDWRPTMMANSARDPYWHAAVRREITDHPSAKSIIENECSTCHMPMAHHQSSAAGQMAEVFKHLPANRANTQMDLLAVDGVSCTSCHQISKQNLGTRESFVGRISFDSLNPIGQRKVYGPYPIDAGRSNIMHSSSGFLQAESKHIQQSELCATCHTLYTHTLGPDGEVIGELPEQVPYLEWRHSSFVNNQSCQSCHMPVVQDSVPISSVWGQPRAGFSRHSFRGGNFFMISMLNRYRDELGVQALPSEMTAAYNRTIQHLQTKSARVQIERTEITGDELLVRVAIKNLAGHKLPTAYPSRRTWLHLTVQDSSGNVIFESGAVRSDGSIKGNDNDNDAGRFESHYNEITREEQVQIYEAILADPDGNVTTGLLTGIRYIKDNRLLPEGFDKTTADKDIAVRGGAASDTDFDGGSDRVRFRINVKEAGTPLRITAELWYQPIAYRWAQNLAPYNSAETTRFVGYYKAMSKQSSVRLASHSLIID